MTTLSEIDKEKNFIKAGIVENQWWGERRLPVVCNRREVMLYIERLEDDRQRLLVSVTQLLVIANNDKGYERGIIDKARHLVKTMAQPERQEAR